MKDNLKTKITNKHNSYIVRHFKNIFSGTERDKNISIIIEDLNNHINRISPTDICRTLYLAAINNTFFVNEHVILIRKRWWKHKMSLSKFQKIKIL